MIRCEWCERVVADAALRFRVEMVNSPVSEDSHVFLCRPECLARYACDVAKMRIT